MDSSQKKISFGFSKVKKTNPLVKSVPVEEKEIQFVDSFDGDKGKFSYQGTRLEEEVKKPLVIPLVGTRTAYEVIKAKLEEKAELIEEDVKPSLDVLAAREILSGINNEETEKKDTKTMVIVPDTEKPSFAGEKESSLEDYENIPVDDFGLAMLRGMGWSEETGIGKDGRIVEPVTTELRPKRLGLGAQCPKPPGDRKPLVKGSLVEILAGLHKNSVGVVESLDGDTGSIFIKLTNARVLSISENWVVGITRTEFEKKLNGAKKPEPEAEKKYGIVIKENSPKKKRHRSRSRDRGHKKSKKHRRRSSSDEHSSRKSKKKHRR